MHRYIHRLEYYARRHGLRRTARMTAGNLYVWGRDRIVGRRRERMVAEESRDSELGIDTCRTVWPGEMHDVDSPNREHANRYLPTPSDEFRSIVDKLPIDFNEYTFIDYGSGKGRALLLASEYAFKEVIGVEFSKDLHQVAESNIAAFTSPRQKCKQVSSVCMDAVKFELPAVPLVLYFFLPFDESVMTQVLDGIEKSLADSPRPLILVYYNLPYKEVLDGCSWMSEMHSDEDYSLYASVEAVPVFANGASDGKGFSREPQPEA